MYTDIIIDGNRYLNTKNVLLQVKNNKGRIFLVQTREKIYLNVTLSEIDKLVRPTEITLPEVATTSDKNVFMYVSGYVAYGKPKEKARLIIYSDRNELANTIKGMFKNYSEIILLSNKDGLFQEVKIEGQDDKNKKSTNGGYLTLEYAYPVSGIVSGIGTNMREEIRLYTAPNIPVNTFSNKLTDVEESTENSDIDDILNTIIGKDTTTDTTTNTTTNTTTDTTTDTTTNTTTDTTTNTTTDTTTDTTTNTTTDTTTNSTTNTTTDTTETIKDVNITV